jgi:hypothetical protein
MPTNGPRPPRRRRRAFLLLPIVPVLALVSAVWLPFVNSDRLWLGLPALFVWTAVWVLLLTPTLVAVEWGFYRRRGAEDPR